MLAVDTSILAYAVNRYAPEHSRASRVVEDLANGASPWALPWPVVHDFLALVTHPHAVARPLGPGDAWGFIASLRASASLQLLGPTDRHAEILAEVLGPGFRGPALPPGLATATVLREHGVREILSADRGMRRFVFLAVRDPIHGETWAPEAGPVHRYRRLKIGPPRG
jgi:hypothetical protein